MTEATVSDILTKLMRSPITRNDRVFANILHSHDVAIGTSLSTQEPVLCAKAVTVLPWSEWPRTSGKYLSQAIHGFHATKKCILL